jgi:hypothetical protein
MVDAIYVTIYKDVMTLPVTAGSTSATRRDYRSVCRLIAVY